MLRTLLLSMIVAASTVVLLARPAFAQPGIALHAVPATGDAPDCANAPTSFGCGWRTSGLITSADLNQAYDVYVVAVETDTAVGISAAGFSIDYHAPGTQVLAWSSCGDQVTTDNNWPAPGGRISVSFNPDNCQGRVMDSAWGSYGGYAVLAVLRVIASEIDMLQVDAYDDGNMQITGCDGASGGLVVQLGTAGEIGFGFTWTWDPCNSRSFYDHICWVFPTSVCSCCLPNGTCRYMSWYFDNRNCRDAGGTPHEGESCDACVVSVTPSTWSGIKARHR